MSPNTAAAGLTAAWTKSHLALGESMYCSRGMKTTTTKWILPPRPQRQVVSNYRGPPTLQQQALSTTMPTLDAVLTSLRADVTSVSASSFSSSFLSAAGLLGTSFFFLFLRRPSSGFGSSFTWATQVGGNQETTFTCWWASVTWHHFHTLTG